MWRYSRGVPVGLLAVVLPAWMGWVMTKFKRVALDDTSLYVSNFIHEVVVPLDQVDHVSERLRPVRSVVLELTQNTRFGRRVEFCPPGLSHPPPPHPMVIELESVVGAAKRAKETGAVRG
jgi:hypothetical protein